MIEKEVIESLTGTVRWLVGAAFAIGAWCAGMSYRLAGKANKSDVAKLPVEADMLELYFQGFNEKLDQMAASGDKRSTMYIKRLDEIDERLAATQKHVAVLRDRSNRSVKK